MAKIETDEREKERERNRDGNDETGSHVVQKEDQNDDDEQNAAQQIVLDRSCRERDQLTAVVERVDLDVLRENAGVELLRHRLDALEHRLRLLAGAHQNDALDRVILIVITELSQPRRVSNDDVADVVHEDWRAVLDGEDDIPDVIERDDAAESAHIEELPTLG